MIQRVTKKIGDTDLILETGKIGKQANGCVYAQFGGTAVIATVCASSNVTEGMDFVPVTVDYNEKFYAAGKIPGGFVKREGRPKDKEILVSRLIDRPMRPLFEPTFGREIQIVPTCVSVDGKNPPDILAVIAASAAVTISDIPFHGPVAGVRVCYLNGEYVLNPTYEQIEKSQLEIVVAGTKDGFTMVEGGANEAGEDVMLGALEKAQDFIREMCILQEELQKLAGKDKLPLAPLDVKLENAEAIEAEAVPLMKGGWTAVKVTSLPDFLWQSNNLLISTSDTPSPYVSINGSSPTNLQACLMREPVIALRPVYKRVTFHGSQRFI